MSFVPEFELGLWNAWVFMGPFFVVTLLILFFMVKKGAPGSPSRAVQRACKSRSTMFVAVLSKFIYFPAVLYSVFLPLKLGSVWFYVGFPVMLLGLVGSVLVLVDWARTPVGEPVVCGIYRFSRHPMYVTMFLVLLGVSIACVSWVFLLFTMVFAVGVTRPFFVKLEEAECLGHFGAAYRDYMNRTPRWFGKPKQEKKD
jgi:protein-S-isoprenylcysteine O-methyltransferase Ste14